MEKPKFELSDIILEFSKDYQERYKPPACVLKVFRALQNCKTPLMGWHKHRCSQCGYEKISYNSCRNRHCPKCQGVEREVWIAKTGNMIPKGKYFHVVFTLPESLNHLFLSHKKQMQDILFCAAWETIVQFSNDVRYLGANSGMISVLHTWGQTLALHPHLHCIVPAGGVDKQNKWIKAKRVDNKTSFLFPIKAMAKVFRGIFLREMSGMLKSESLKTPTIKEPVFNVYAKQPFRDVTSVIEYLGRYTHKIAITNQRIRNVEDGKVTFRYKDYKEEGKGKDMTLDGVEFLRRFALHIQPPGYRRIRCYGFFAASKREQLGKIRKNLRQAPASILSHKEWKEKVLIKWNSDYCLCPNCKQGEMVIIESVKARPPPINENTIESQNL